MGRGRDRCVVQKQSMMHLLFGTRPGSSFSPQDNAILVALQRAFKRAIVLADDLGQIVCLFLRNPQDESVDDTSCLT